ncbi:MAG: tetratricopeptide repeat protein [Nitrospirota bacterium]|nr:tetratricopeptide repeat protein [Nitrospirota bacterium]
MRHIFAIISRVCHCEAKPKQSLLCAIAIAFFLFYPSHGFTAVKEIVSEGAYNMGDGETPSVAESRALLNAKRVAIEQAGTYVESYTKVENFQLTKDEIQVLASGIMEVEILDKKRTIVGDGFRFWVKIKARVNPDRIQEMANKVKDKSVVEDYKKIQEAYDKSQKEIGELKKQFAQTKGEKEKKQVEAKITDDERMFQANEWFAKGYQHNLNNELDKAIEAYTNAIALNPNYVEAYNNRGIAYYNKGLYHSDKRQLDRAIEDFNKVVILNPNSYSAYFAQGATYLYKEQYDKAIEEFNKAIVLNPNSDLAYVGRGFAYNKQKEFERAIEDYNKAIQLGGYWQAMAYSNRGLIRADKKQYDMAIDDISKAIALAPNNAKHYCARGLTYALSGNLGRAIPDLQKSCDMGDKIGCDYLQKVLQSR